MTDTQEIHVYLLDEGTDVWRPVDGQSLGQGAFRIVSQNPHPEDEKWQFATGDVVRCEIKELMDGAARVARLVAVEKIEAHGTAEPAAEPDGEHTAG